MIVLFVGGPLAGKFHRWPDPPPPKILIPVQSSCFNYTDVDPDTTFTSPWVEYTQGLGSAPLEGTLIHPYYDLSDPDRRERSLDRLEGKARVDALALLDS